MTGCLVTGGAGFIGSHFVRLASSRTYSPIVVIDSRTYAGQSGQLQPLIDSGRITFVKNDICNVDCLEYLLHTFDISLVVHFAAETHVDRSILSAQSFVHSNIQGTFALLEVLRKHWVDQNKQRLFVHVSTDEVFGNLGSNDRPFTERSPYQPRNPYSATKAAADHLVHAWSNTYGLPVVTTHCCNNFGPWQYPEKLIPLMIINAVDLKELPVYGDGRQSRDWIHVEDHCEALFHVINLSNPRPSYAISSGEEHRNIEVVLQICDSVDTLLQRPIGTSRALIKYVADRPGHDRRYSLDPSTVRQETGWRPRHSLLRSIPDLVAWYYQHRTWADAVRERGDYRSYYDLQYANRPLHVSS
jgi:dTDP-glucose 4,6-dehydratase